MRITSLKINGRTVSRLFINGREVALGSATCDALCFIAKQNQSTIKLTKVGNPDLINLQTSTNGSSWRPYNVEETITVPNIGGKVYFKAVGSNYRMASSPSDYHKFEFNGEFEASGNVNSLLEENKETARAMSLEGKQFCYAYLFSGTNLTTAPELPATTLAYGCYAMMFQDCPSLTQAPELPATTLETYCYYNMFSGCQALAQAPTLPATTLVDSCYTGMFTNCLSLNYIAVAFDSWVPYTTDNWLPETTGTFKCSQALIGNTPERSTSTVPESWTMTAA